MVRAATASIADCSRLGGGSSPRRTFNPAVDYARASIPGSGGCSVPGISNCWVHIHGADWGVVNSFQDNVSRACKECGRDRDNAIPPLFGNTWRKSTRNHTKPDGLGSSKTSNSQIARTAYLLVPSADYPAANGHSARASTNKRGAFDVFSGD